MRTRILFLVSFLVGLVAFANRSHATVIADPPGAGVLALQDAGSASAPAPAPAPADSLHDPLSSPQGAMDDIKAAKKVGWGMAVLVVLVLASRLAARAGGVFSFLGKGKVALVIGAACMLAVTAYDALARGGSWMASLFGAALAAAAYWDAHAKAAEPKA